MNQISLVPVEVEDTRYKSFSQQMAEVYSAGYRLSM